MPFYILSVILQVAFVIHIVKTRRDTKWIWIVVMLPIAGVIAYIILEVLPDITGSRTVRMASGGVVKKLDPDKGMRSAVRDCSIANTIENTLRLAEECMNKGMYEEAKGLYKKSLTGVHRDDPSIMYGLARSEFALGNFQQAKTTLDQLIEQNPDYKNQEAHLLYARTVEALGDMSQAHEEYEVLAGYYVGAEAKYRYSELLKKERQIRKSNDLLNEIVQTSKISGKHYKLLNKEWITKAKKELNR
ncbi:MAG: hypothetical protein D6B27_10100 [Gammaproteobacteria bacterium]|nr:MAG: hypothetical protein D6B27_10100 [Gammaproteobacteria bacterium]